MGGVGAAMLAGTVVSAVLGGVAGLAFAVTRDQGLVQTVLSYQIGGLVAAMAFLTLSQRQARLRG